MASKSETVNLNVLIAERWYPLKVLKADEEKLQAAVKLVNDKITEHQEKYAGKDKQDYMAMCLLNFAVEKLNSDIEQQEQTRALEEQINRLEATLSGPLE